MLTTGSMPGELWSGGFWAVRPNMTALNMMSEQIQMGNFDRGGGWDKTGAGRWWGGATVQGILPWYAYYKMDQSKRKEVDTCRFNNQVGAREEGGNKTRGGEGGQRE